MVGSAALFRRREFYSHRNGSMAKRKTGGEVARFAPSPTGYLHIGHVFSALTAYHARGKGGTFHLRIEDIDPAVLSERDPRKLIPPLHGALLKNEQDVMLFEKLAFMTRRNSGGPGGGPGVA